MTDAEIKKMKDLAEKSKNRVYEYLKMVLLKRAYLPTEDNPDNKKRPSKHDIDVWKGRCRYYKSDIKESLVWVLGYEFDIPKQVIRDFNWSLTDNDQESIFDLILDFHLKNERRLEPTDILFGQIVTLISNNVVHDLATKGMALKTKRSKEYLDWCR